MAAVLDRPSVVHEGRSVVDRANEINMESRGALSKAVTYHCPYRCGKDQCDQYGYCKHLLGFANVLFMTNDERGESPAPVGTKYEPIRPLYRFDSNGEPFDTDLKMVTCRENVVTEPGDVLVNPERLQTKNGVSHMAKRYCSSWVYRQHVADEVKLRPQAIPQTEEAVLRNAKKELERRAEKLRMKKEIAKLKYDLGDPMSDEELELLAREVAPAENRNVKTGPV